jgi:peptidyl-tRNA hydrolase
LNKTAALHAVIKTLPAKFEAEVKGIADWITTKNIQVDMGLSLQREQHQFEDQVLQAQHAQEPQLLQDLLDAVLAQQDRFSRHHLENAHTQK